MRKLHIHKLLVFTAFFLHINLNAHESMSDNTDSISKPNTFTIDGQLLSRGEYRIGGLSSENKEGEDYASFIMERTRLTIGYSRHNLQAKITGQHSGVWGQAGKGTFNLYEAWLRLGGEQGFFAKVGRQELVYDDERIIGNNDWTMAAQSHDVLKLGYETDRHKVHLILGYNQNAENINGGTIYLNGAEPWKNMQTLWYHYDFPSIPLGISLLGMNIGTQNSTENEDVDPNETEYQQLFGTYIKYKPNNWTFEGSYYYQTGRNEKDLPISAWMAAFKVQHDLSRQCSIYGGYDYLSGDDSFHVPSQGHMGLQQLKNIHGFNLLFGSHHQFYGAMDFFYVSTYYGGFTPGLQNLFGGVKWSPMLNLSLNGSYHYLGTATKVSKSSMTLGHEIELSAAYNLMKDVKISCGYSIMLGTKTMERLKRVSDKGNLHWLWLSINASPRIFTTKW